MADGTITGAADATLDANPAAASEELKRFVGLCVPLTGFSAFDLHGTGMAPLYLATARQELGGSNLDDFLSRWEFYNAKGRGPAQLPSRDREIARALVYLWYTGAWPRIAPAVHAELRRERPNGEFMASDTSYAEGLVWRAFGGHPAGAKPPGFGTWAYPPPELPTEQEIAKSIGLTRVGETEAEASAEAEAEGVAAAEPLAYDPTAYGALSDVLDEESVPDHLLPGAWVSRSVPPSIVPPAAPPPEAGNGSAQKDVSER
ncbi:hypothetical protein ABZ926_12705 [Streptomyces litmocidini]|uniref:hypothetical protein n=1 Tax=Streptomyces litmocidini TaxID=67318 RepID=UPI0034084CDB